jgi:hypothetical protein
MVRFLKVLILFSIAAFQVSNAYARYVGPTGTKPKAFFTYEEKSFLLEILNRAQTIVSKNIKNTKSQLECLETPSSCKQKDQREQILSAIKRSYSQYRFYYIMSEFTAIGWQLEPYPNPEDERYLMPLKMRGEWSPYHFTIHPNERDRILGLRKQDLEEGRKKRESCGFDATALKAHYKAQLTNLVSIVPVILLINSSSDTASESEIISAYKELVSSLEETEKNLKEYDKSDLKGLWIYQSVAMELVQEKNQSNEPDERNRRQIVYNQIMNKMTPSFWEIPLEWLKQVFTPANMFLIGCSVLSVVTLNPLIASLCTMAGLGWGAYNLRNDHLLIEQRYDEWLSGVNTKESVTTARIQSYINMALFAVAARAGGHSIKEALDAKAYAIEFQKRLYQDGYSRSQVHAKLKEFSKSFIKSQRRDMMQWAAINQTMSLIQSELKESDVERISQIAADTLVRIGLKGVYTFKDSVPILCVK